jgi:tetratricopeptide (TPR) repeat protein
MIERLLAADAALERGDIETAEKLFGSVAEADPRNAIAAVGMGRVAAGRDDATGARTWFQRALEIDPQEAAARRLLTALDRELAAMAGAPAPAATPVEPPAPAPGPSPSPARSPSPPAPTARPSLLDRIRAWLGLSGRR